MKKYRKMHKYFPVILFSLLTQKSKRVEIDALAQMETREIFNNLSTSKTNGTFVVLNNTSSDMIRLALPHLVDLAWLTLELPQLDPKLGQLCALAA